MELSSMFDRDDLDIRRILGRPKAKIDFITLSLPLFGHGEDAPIRLVRALDGAKTRLAFPEKQWENWFTIHDPTVNDLQRLLNEFPALEILAMEICIDFHLVDGTNDSLRLQGMHSWFKKRLFPQQHRLMRRGCVRKYWSSQTGKVVRDRSLQGRGDNSYYWYSKSQEEFLRLYIKTQDHHRELNSHCLRIEVSMSRGGCQNAQVHRLGMLPSFVDRIRRYLTPFFTVANGIKLEAARCRSNDLITQQEHAWHMQKKRQHLDLVWRKYGAFWAARHNARVHPNKQVKRLIGEALQALREQLTPLTVSADVTKKVEDWRDAYECITRASTGFSEGILAAV